MKEKKCVFCDWERLYNERRKYDWDYVCPECKKKYGLNTTQSIVKLPRGDKDGN